ncbi:membrane protein YcaP [Escherichia coli]|uniref:Membrane protein YcaP n=1 Tax=Escherichia coli TaxID=562 RepID=A0A376VL05_ECOLX|nr:membrane protein YcaP [Escherichia coli]
MKAFDLHRMAFDKVPFDFLGEVALRSLYTFVLVFFVPQNDRKTRCAADVAF